MMGRKCRFLSFSVLLALGFFFFSGRLAAAARDAYKSGILALSLADDAQAVRDFEQALKKKPSDKRVRVPLAFAYFRSGNVYEAERVLAEQIKRSPDELEARILLVHVRFSRGTEDLALTAYRDFDGVFLSSVKKEVRKSIRPGTMRPKAETAKMVMLLAKKIPNLGLPEYIHGLILKKAGDLPNSRTAFFAALERGYSAVDVYVRLMDLAMLQEKAPEALQLAEKIRGVFGETAEICYQEGRAKEMAKDLDGAFERFSMSYNLKPYMAEALVNAARVRRLQGESSKAEVLLGRALKLAASELESLAFQGQYAADVTAELPLPLRYRPGFLADRDDLITPLMKRASELVLSGRIEEALTFLGAFLEYDDSYPLLQCDYALLSNHLGRVREALEHAWLAAKAKPDLKEALDTVGNAFFRIGDIPNAVSFYSKVTVLPEADAMAYYNLGCAHHAERDFATAENDWKTALHIEDSGSNSNAGSGQRMLGLSVQVKPPPVAFNAHLALGKMYRLLDRTDEALDELDKAASLHPGDPEPWFEVGCIHSERGEAGPAEESFSKYLSLGGSEAKVAEFRRR
ncbi:MAG: tetratricopeptide repeat protein [Candidatus Aminicenantales bacterium]